MKSNPRIPKSSAAARSTGPMSLLRRMLFGHVRVKSRDGALQMTWGETLLGPAQEAARPSPATAQYPANDERARVLPELAILLNANPTTRKVLRHLVFLESAFARKGYGCLDDIPVKTLRRAHEQLEMLASSWSSRDLEALALRMAAALVRRGGGDPSLLDQLDTSPSVARVEVQEGRLSDFFILADEVIRDSERGELQPST